MNDDLMLGLDAPEGTPNMSPAISDPPTYAPIEGTNLCEVTDIFGGTHICDPMDVDIMSGLPSSSFGGVTPNIDNAPSFIGGEVESYDQMRLDKSNEIEAMRDTAVEHYKDAKASGNLEEMLKWEVEANKQQGRLYDHWGTPTYGLPPKAPGIS